jgi:hypothetical protein
LVAAQNLGGQWIAIDSSPTACRVMAKRLRDVCSMKLSEPLWKAYGPNAFIVRDLPWTAEKLRALPHFEFENWAVIAQPGLGWVGFPIPACRDRLATWVSMAECFRLARLDCLRR